MRTTAFGTNNTPQDLYFPDDHLTMPGWFKGMETIIREHGLWPEKGLNAQCESFKCIAGKKDCCCRWLLFTQPDFMHQKSHLEELIKSRGHICDFYPKYHCELNFIEQYWGAAKLIYRSTSKTTDMKEMERNVRECLDDVPHVQIQRCASSPWTLFLNTDLIFHQLIINVHQLRKPCSSFHQCLWPRPDWSGGSLGKSQISWAPHTTTRYGFEVKKGAREEV